MTFHLPGNELSVMSSKAETPFSSCRLKPGLTPATLKGSSLSPTVFIRCSVGFECPSDRGRRAESCRVPWESLCGRPGRPRSEEHTSELQSRENLVCRLLLEK